MALPNKPFIINYNARDYNPSTYTIPKHPDQTLDLDAYFYNGSAITKYDDYIHTVSAYTQHTFSSTSANPFNRDSNNKSLTIIYKYANLITGGGSNIIANRGTNYNWMARFGVFHTSNGSFLPFTEPNTPHTTVVRIQSNGTSERWVDGDKANYYASASSISYGSLSNAFGLLVGYGNSVSEVINSIDFYWIYVTTEALTDEEINQVIAFNTKTFEVDTDEINAPHQGSSYTVTLNSDLPWSLLLTDTFFTVSPDSGDSGTTLLTVNVEQNFGNARSDHFIILDDELAEIEVMVSQEKAPVRVPYKSMYRNGSRIT